MTLCMIKADMFLFIRYCTAWACSLLFLKHITSSAAILTISCWAICLTCSTDTGRFVAGMFPCKESYSWRLRQVINMFTAILIILLSLLKSDDTVYWEHC